MDIASLLVILGFILVIATLVTVFHSLLGLPFLISALLGAPLGWLCTIAGIWLFSRTK